MPRKHLTEEGVAKLSPPPMRHKNGQPIGSIDYTDAHTVGLVLRVNYGGKKVWRARYYVRAANKKGKQVLVARTHRLGRYPILKLKEAREAARKFLANPTTQALDIKSETFREVAASYIKRHVEEKKLRTKYEIERCLNKYVLPMWGDQPFRSIEREHVTKLLDHIADNHGPVQADMVLAIIRKMMIWYQSRVGNYEVPVGTGMRRSNPAERRRERFLGDDERYGDEEIRALWKAADECGPFGGMVKMLLVTAQRLRKVAHMQHDDISDDGIWTIRTEPREKGNPGKLRLPELALNVIKAQPRIAGNPYVFVGERSGRVASFTDSKRELDAKLKQMLPHMKPWRLHDLRRTARSLMARRDCGVSPYVAEQVLGHKIPGVAGIYDRHSYLDEKADALNRLATLVERIVAPPSGDNVVAMAPTARKKRR